jgi:hypothetical protein
LAKFDLKGYARRGAESRITELTQELDAIFGAFPDLRPRSRGGKPVDKVVLNQEEQIGPAGAKLIKIEETGAAPITTNRRRRRRKLSAAQRKTIGERMRKYWAARRAESATKKR